MSFAHEHRYSPISLVGDAAVSHKLRLACICGHVKDVPTTDAKGMPQAVLNVSGTDQRLMFALIKLLTDWYAGSTRLELLLADAGLNYKEIARALGKKPDAIRMLLRRQAKKEKFG